MPTPHLQPIADLIAKEAGFSSCEYVAGGAFKETFCVGDPSGLKLALKIVDRAKIDKKRTVREVDAIAKCKSPHIAKISKVFTYRDSGGIEYDVILEEFLDGGTLAERLNKTPFQLEQFKSLGEGLVVAIEELMLNKLVHRDIKPENIMFRANSDVPVLVDFGIVRDLSKPSLTANWIMQGPGTPLYAAPEQLNNEKEQISWKTDQFSLGVVLAYVKFGRHPYWDLGMDDQEIVSAVAARHVSPSFAQLAKGDRIANCILRMVKPWPVERFASTAELKTRITTF